MKRRTFLQFIGLASVSGAAVAKGVDLPMPDFGEFTASILPGDDWLNPTPYSVGDIAVGTNGIKYRAIMADADGVRVSRIY